MLIQRLRDLITLDAVPSRARSKRGIRRSTQPPEVTQLLELRTMLAATLPEFVDPNPKYGNMFGDTVVPLSNGNVVITAPGDDTGGTDVGAVYLFNGATRQLISTLRGSTANDRVGENTYGDAVVPLPNGNFLVLSPKWDNGSVIDAGAVTFVNGTSGLNSTISAANSLVGSAQADMDGYNGVSVSILKNGNYVVVAPYWDNGSVVNAGAVTLGSGTSGISGPITGTKSLVGASNEDNLGSGGVYPLSNGNYVISSPNWDNGAAIDAGAATFGNGTSGITGSVSAANSLVGTKSNDLISTDGITALPSGNYVIRSSEWDNGVIADAGAVTFGNGTSGITGTVSVSNSLVGSSASDFVGAYHLTVLTNGNYVVCSPFWSNGSVLHCGAVTFGNGATGVKGTITSSNSLIGSTTDDQIGETDVEALTNGNYVVISNLWNNGTIVDAGAVTLGDGTNGTVGLVSSLNSLVGTHNADYVGSDGIVPLTNGNYVVISPSWDNGAVPNAGAATFASGTTRTSGNVSATNSLVGTTANDSIGGGFWGAEALPNGNYVVVSPSWDNGTIVDAGAVTFGNGSTGISGTVTAANSLVGSHTDDLVGDYGVFPLTNGNYVVASALWDNGLTADAGAVTFGSGTSGIKGVISATNSLVGTQAGDFVGNDVEPLPNGNYVVSSSEWRNSKGVSVGASTLGNGTNGVTGTISSGNSLIGVSDDTADTGFRFETMVLGTGNYLVINPTADTFSYGNSNDDQGAVTFGSSTNPVKGIATFRNTIFGLDNHALKNVVEDRINKCFYVSFIDGRRVAIGSTETGPYQTLGSWFTDPNPRPGNEFGDSVTPLASGNVIVTSPGDDTAGLDAGAVYLFDGRTRTVISTLTGASTNDSIGDSGGVALPNGNFVLRSPHWTNGTAQAAGAVTLINGTTGLNGVVSAANSLVGSTADDFVGGYDYSITVLTNGNYVVATPGWTNGTITNAGAVTFGNGTTGITGPITASNSLVGGNVDDQIGKTNEGYSSAIAALSNGNYVIGSPYWDNSGLQNVGAATLASGTAGISGLISQANSLVGSQTGDSVGWSVTALTNGNYVVVSTNWSNGAASSAGAVTFGSGTTGVKGIVSSANSLVGASTDDFVGFGGVAPLTNGNYVIGSPYWNDSGLATVGAATFASGTAGISGLISQANSLVGSQTGDSVGWSVTALTNGNYVVVSPYWANGAVTQVGAVTFASGSTGLTGTVATTNSLVGKTLNDHVGVDGVFPLTNGNYVVASRVWDNGTIADVGAATFVNGAIGLTGAVTSSNSLIGTTTGDQVGSWVTPLTNGNYVVSSYNWDNGTVTDAGAATFCNGATGRVGTVSAVNSLVGTTLDDGVGSVEALKNGSYLLVSQGWDNGSLTDAGAITFGKGDTGISGIISASNSLVGSHANDYVGLEEDGPVTFSNGSFVFANYYWNGFGAYTFGNGTSGLTGSVSKVNSIIAASGDGYAYLTDMIADNVNGLFYVGFPDSAEGKIYVGSQTEGFSPRISAVADITINEDAAEQTVNLSGIYAGWGQGRPLKVTAVSNNTSLLPNPGVTYASPNSTGTLKFKPVSQRNGTATVTVTVEDGGQDGMLETADDNLTVSRSFVVTVKAIRPTIQSPSGNVTQQRPKLQWTAVPGAAKYDVWIANSTTMVNPYHRGQSTTTSYDVPVDLGIGKIDVWVRAVMPDGSTLPWSAMQRFSVITGPTLSALDVRQTTARPTVSWGSLYGATSWDVWVSNVTVGGIQAARATVTGTSWTPTADLPMARYRVWVRAMGAGGFVGAWSTFKEFYVAPVPTVTGPVNPTFNRRPVFDWGDVAGATSYGISVKNLVTGAVVADVSGLPTSTWTPTTDLPDARYVWFGIADSTTAGFRSSWTARTEFNVGGVTTVTGPASPSSSKTPLLQWLAVDGAVRYELWVNGDTEGPKLIFKTDVTTNSFQVVTPLGSGRTYRMWVRAVSSDARFSAWSDTYVFTVTQSDSPKESEPNSSDVPELKAAALTLLTGNPEMEIQRDLMTPKPESSHQTVEISVEAQPVAQELPLRSTNEAAVNAGLLQEFFALVANTSWLDVEEGA